MLSVKKYNKLKIYNINAKYGQQPEPLADGVIISIINFKEFLDNVYDDVIQSYYSQPLEEKAKQLKKEELDDDFKKRLLNALANTKRDANDIVGIVNTEMTKVKLFERENYKKPDQNKDFNLKKACEIKNANFTFSDFINSSIKDSMKSEDNFIDWVEHIHTTIKDMSTVYSNFKNSKTPIDIKTNFNSLRHYYSEIIENLKRRKIHQTVLFLLDDIFFRILQWEQKSSTNTDSLLLRNAFSHFNVVYDKQSLILAGSKFKTIFMKKNSLAQYEALKKGFKEGYSSIDQRILFFNHKQKGSAADAILDTSCDMACKYFMTFCHCLYAIFTNCWEKVPFSDRLLNEFREIYVLDCNEHRVFRPINYLKLTNNDNLIIEDGHISENNNLFDLNKTLQPTTLNESNLGNTKYTKEFKNVIFTKGECYIHSFGKTIIKCNPSVSSSTTTPPTTSTTTPPTTSTTTPPTTSTTTATPKSSSALGERIKNLNTIVIKKEDIDQQKNYSFYNSEIYLKIDEGKVKINNEGEIIIENPVTIKLLGKFIVTYSEVNPDSIIEEVENKLKKLKESV